MNSTTKKTLKTEMRKAEIGAEDGGQRMGLRPDWWGTLPAGERSVIRAVAVVLREAKASGSLEMAWAAAKWERALGCFIKVRLVAEKQKAERRNQRTEDGGRKIGCGRLVAPV